MKENRVFNNAKWIVVCKFAQSVLQMIVGMISARYLGPSNYGLISYAASVAAFAIPIMRLGFDATLVREYVEAPDNEGEIAGTSVALNIMSGIASMITPFPYKSSAHDIFFMEYLEVIFKVSRAISHSVAILNKDKWLIRFPIQITVQMILYFTKWRIHSAV